jgi:hypothetical protein
MVVERPVGANLADASWADDNSVDASQGDDSQADAHVAGVQADCPLQDLLDALGGCLRLQKDSPQSADWGAPLAWRVSTV